jgi:hypothetical protein
MKPWVRVTDNQIEELQSGLARLESLITSSSENIDYELNQGITDTFTFTPLEDGSTQSSAGAVNFTGAITSESDISLAGSLIVGDPSRQEYNPVTGEPIALIPTLEVISGKSEINPITELEYYKTGQLNINDTSLNVDAYGVIHGDGLQITLVNDGQLERNNIAILGATGNGTSQTFQIANNSSNVALYTAGKYVDISGIDPSGYNGDNLLIVSVNTGVSPMTFTVAGETSATYVAGGYVTINQANSIYEGKLSVQGPAPAYTGVTVDQNGVHVGTNGGDPAVSNVTLDSTGLTAPNAFIDQAIINGTRFFISDTPPTAVNDGDIWLDRSGSIQLPSVIASALTIGNPSLGGAYQLQLSGTNAGLRMSSSNSGGGSWIDFNNSGGLRGNIYYNYDNNTFDFGTYSGGAFAPRVAITSTGIVARESSDRFPVGLALFESTWTDGTTSSNRAALNLGSQWQIGSDSFGDGNRDLYFYGNGSTRLTIGTDGLLTLPSSLNITGAASTIRLAGNAGTAGQILTSQGGATLPTWSNPSPFKMAAGQLLGQSALAANAQSSGVTLTLPAGRFTQPPIVTVISTSPRYVIAIGTVTTSTANVTVRNVSDASGTTYDLYFQAIQMTSGSSAG